MVTYVFPFIGSIAKEATWRLTSEKFVTNPKNSVGPVGGTGMKPCGSGCWKTGNGANGLGAFAYKRGTGRGGRAGGAGAGAGGGGAPM